MGGKKKTKSKGERKPGVQNEMSDMSTILSDPRFAHVAKDPKLRHVPKQQRKIKLDNRFSGVFTDDRFYETSTMDPRGKKGNFSTKEDLQKFYDLSSEDDTSDEEDEEAEEEGEAKDESGSSEVEKSDEEQEDDTKYVDKIYAEGKKLQTKKELKNKSSKDDEENDEIIPLEVSEVLKDMQCDYARGDMIFSDDSSDDDSSSDSDSDNEDDDNQETKDEFEWGELDQNAVWDDENNQVEETRRFAVCNMDWDRIKASDLMILFSSFCPREGSVESVTIYPSEYGKKRIAEEDRYGPQELRTNNKGKNKTDAERDLKDLEKLEKGKLDEDDGSTKKHFEALRRYQRNRLLYYYAVVVCDAVETAATVYKHCDRQPFEGAGVLLDLRYIPDEMTFDDVPHDLCKEVPKSYEVRTFTTTALHDTRPTLTWDETNPDRKKTIGSAMNRATKGEQVDQDQVMAFLASGSEEESEDEVSVSGSDVDNSDDEDIKDARIAKFRALINEIDEKERKKNEEKDEFDMEETFEYDEAKKKDEPENNNKTIDKSKSELTPFEKYLEKKKENKKIRKKKLKEEQLCSESGSETDESDNEEKEEEGGESIMSDDELPDSMKGIYNDPFFSDEIKKNKKLKKKKNKKEENSEHGEDADGKLELLIMNEEEDEKKHFNMRDIIKDANTKTTKNRWKAKKNKVKKIIEMKKESKQEDDFKVDLVDSRFSAIMTTGEFNIDPSHPHFKRTKAMDGLINQIQQKRTADSMEDIPESKRHNIGNKKNKKDDLSLLVNKVKNKTKNKNR